MEDKEMKRIVKRDTILAGLAGLVILVLISLAVG